MYLCIDIGNTNIKIGLFEDQNILNQWRFVTDRGRLADEYAAMLITLLETAGIKVEQIEGCVFSSVVPALTQEFSDLVRRHLHCEPVIVGKGANTGILIHTENPQEVGTDLVSNAVAARKLFGAPVIIVGMGTATTLSAVSKDGIFEGVAIAPGLASGSEALFRVAAQLPMVELAHPKAAIGKNTAQSIQSGLVWGYVGLIDSLVNRFQIELGGNARVIATGGLAGLVAGESKTIEQVEPNLTLLGLAMIYALNQSKRCI
jgi:type III pantothenate kinase